MAKVGLFEEKLGKCDGADWVLASEFTVRHTVKAEPSQSSIENDQEYLNRAIVCSLGDL